jgi:hypothetical protein
MLKDAEFVADLKKVTQSSPNYRVGVSGEKSVTKLHDAPVDVKAFIKKYTNPKK